MKIAVLGGGAMGGLFSGYLSRRNDVTIIDVNQVLVDTINQKGVCVWEPDGELNVFHPYASVCGAGMSPVDLMIIFVKAMYSEHALEVNQELIGQDTYLMTLQNGRGHEELLMRFADKAHIIIGTTQHNASVGGIGVTFHGGEGHTVIGCLEGGTGKLENMARNFSSCGIPTSASGEVQKMIWNKLFTNVSVSALTGALQCPLGYIRSNPYAWKLCARLVREAVDVANAEGMEFDYQQKLDEVAAVCDNSPDGVTSICADIRKGRCSEVDTISGSVVKAGRQNGVPAPSHEFLVSFIHALEGLSGLNREE